MKDLDWSDVENDAQRMMDMQGLPKPELTVTHGVTVDPESDRDSGVSDADLAKAVRRQLKMPDWVPVLFSEPDSPSDPGTWVIETTDIEANGQWYVDGQNEDGIPNIDIMLVELTTEDSPRFARPPQPADEPSDDDVVEIERRMEAASNSWERISSLVEDSIRHGDPDLLRQARDLLPHLGGNLLNLLTAMNAAIEHAG